MFKLVRAGGANRFRGGSTTLAVCMKLNSPTRSSAVSAQLPTSSTKVIKTAIKVVNSFCIHSYWEVLFVAADRDLLLK